METINDILKEMKGANFQPPMYQVWVNEYADRIEAAHEREMGVSKTDTTTPTCKASLQVGNEHKPMTLDEAIAHAEEAVNDTPCGREHKQLADWLKKLREIKIGNIAKTREALAAYLALWDNGTMNSIDELKQVIKQMREALSAPARPCDTVPWREAWVKWRSEVHPVTPVTYKECYDSTAAFMDWYMSAAESEVQ